MYFLILMSVLSMATSRQDHRGKKFIIGFLENRILHYTDPVARIYLSSQSNNDVQVEISAPFQRIYQNVTIKRNSMQVVNFNTSVHIEGNNKQMKGLMISASEDITVQAGSINDLSSDAYLALPLDTLSKEYYIITYQYIYDKHYLGPRHRQGPCQIGIIGTYPTKLTIVHLFFPENLPEMPSVTRNFYSGPLKNVAKIELAEMEIIQIQSQYDLTGTKIVSTQPVVALAGSVWTSIGGLEMGDQLLEQMIPLDRWGTEFIAVPFANRSSGDIFRILAKSDETLLRIYRNSRPGTHQIKTINGGDYFDLDLDSEDLGYIVSSKGVLTAHFSKSFSADNHKLTDPSMTLLPPSVQFTSNISFVTLASLHDSYQNYVNIIVPSGKEESLRFDDKPLASELSYWNNEGWRTVKHSNYSVIRVELSSLSVRHTLTMLNDEKFFAVAYGMRLQEMYAHPLGLQVNILPYPCTPSVSHYNDGFDNDCDQLTDEEIKNGIDDDSDGLIDEDLFYNGTIENQFTQPNNQNVTIKAQIHITTTPEIEKPTSKSAPPLVTVPYITGIFENQTFTIGNRTEINGTVFLGIWINGTYYIGKIVNGKWIRIDSPNEITTQVAQEITTKPLTTKSLPTFPSTTPMGFDSTTTDDKNLSTEPSNAANHNNSIDVTNGGIFLNGSKINLPNVNLTNGFNISIINGTIYIGIWINGTYVVGRVIDGKWVPILPNGNRITSVKPETTANDITTTIRITTFVTSTKLVKNYPTTNRPSTQGITFDKTTVTNPPITKLQSSTTTTKKFTSSMSPIQTSSLAESLTGTNKNILVTTPKQSSTTNKPTTESLTTSIDATSPFSVILVNGTYIKEVWINGSLYIYKLVNNEWIKSIMKKWIDGNFYQYAYINGKWILVVMETFVNGKRRRFELIDGKFVETTPGKADSTADYEYEVIDGKLVPKSKVERIDGTEIRYEYVNGKWVPTLKETYKDGIYYKYKYINGKWVLVATEKVMNGKRYILVDGKWIAMTKEELINGIYYIYELINGEWVIVSKEKLIDGIRYVMVDGQWIIKDRQTTTTQQETTTRLPARTSLLAITIEPTILSTIMGYKATDTSLSSPASTEMKPLQNKKMKGTNEYEV
ncbi:DgyrCDS11490 [Dimorphilus gyrociliatus]|uniref:DgyrCDS11490 n=1 Tax=Dimorphilus gyrociliatus TaxID=2664684 RepID=A0A7I8W811_9ANNE|nr:DgyrCDS11490 [Dimorphilus gyrociliatus]